MLSGRHNASVGKIKSAIRSGLFSGCTAVATALKTSGLKAYSCRLQLAGLLPKSTPAIASAIFAMASKSQHNRNISVVGEPKKEQKR
jgi:hypothetical protein